MLGYGSRAGVVSATVLVSGACLGLSVMAVRSPWSPMLLERLSNLGRPTFHAQEYVPVIAPRVPGVNGADPDIDASTVQPDRLQPLTPEQAAAANLQLPFARAGWAVAAPFALPAGSQAADMARARTCMTTALYYEARSEGVDGERAVAQVVMNRLRHRLYPKSVCGVVYQGAERPTGCQFTFACDGSTSRPPELKAWAQAEAVADQALHGRVFGPVGLATHYHTRWVLPYWAPTMEKLTQIGAHIFYRWSGAAGAARSYEGRYAGGEPGAALETAPSPVLLEAPVALQAPVAAAIAPTAVLGPREAGLTHGLSSPAALIERVEPPAALSQISAEPSPRVIVAPDPIQPHGPNTRVNRLATPSNW